MDCHTFDTAAEMISFWEGLQKRRAALDENIAPWQAAICAGDYVFRLIFDGTPLAIFMEIMAPKGMHDKFVMSERPNSRLVRAWSKRAPDSGVGLCDVATIWGVISPAVFNEAKAIGWGMPPALQDRFRPIMDGIANGTLGVSGVGL